MTLISHYPLDGDFNDRINHRHGGGSGVVWINSVFGQAAQMNAGTITIPTPITTLYSLAFWVRLKSSHTGSFRKFLQKGPDRYPGGWFMPNYDGLHLRHHLDQHPNAGVDAPGLSPNVWSHVVFTCRPDVDGQTYLQCYVDGILKSSTSKIGFPLVQGADFEFLSEDYDLADFRVYDHIVSPLEAHELSLGLVARYDFENTSTLRDKSPWGRDGIIPEVDAGEFVSDSVVGDRSASFGANKTLFGGYGKNVPITQTTRMTVVCWAKCRRASAQEMVYSFSIVANGRRLYVGPRSGFWQLGVRTSSWIAGGVPIKVDEWVQVVLRIENGVATLTVDGVVARSVAFANFFLEENIRLGTQYTDTNNTATFSYDGLLDDVRIYASVLSDADLLKLRRSKLLLGSKGDVFGRHLNETPPLVMRQVGGPLVANMGTNVPDNVLRSTHPSSKVTPFAISGTFESQIDRDLYDKYVTMDNVVWYKYITTYDENARVVNEQVAGTDGLYPSTSLVLLKFPAGVSMQDVLDAANGEQLNGQVEMFIDDLYYGKTDIVNKYTSATIGFANKHAADRYGQTDDNLMEGWGARHVVSYRSTEAGTNAVRCQFQCWGGQSHLVEVVWGCKPL